MERIITQSLEALEHASACPRDGSCVLPACINMKELLIHRIMCDVRIKGGCEKCRRVLVLVQIHAKKCTSIKCPVPHCAELKVRLSKRHI